MVMYNMNRKLFYTVKYHSTNLISKMASLIHFCVNFTKVSTGKGMDFIHQARKRVWKMACLGLK